MQINQTGKDNSQLYETKGFRFVNIYVFCLPTVRLLRFVYIYIYSAMTLFYVILYKATDLK